MTGMLSRARITGCRALTAGAVVAGVLVLPAAPPAAAAGHISFNWTNRGPGDGFDTVFGTNQDLARANVAAALERWAQVIVALNRPSAPTDNTLEVTVNMNPGATATSCGGSAGTDVDGDGYPTGGRINIRGNATNWFLDPTPLDDSEFTGNIDNPFSGDAQPGSPANGLCDMQTVVMNEATHILGVTSTAGSRFQTDGFNTRLTTTGTTCSGPGDLWQFTGPSVTALMTSNNGGNSGSDFRVPVHTAEPCATSGTLSGSNNTGNALFEGSRRYLPSNLDALILKDSYNYEIVMPETFGSFHSMLNRATGELLIRGGDDNDTSADSISVTRAGDISTSVDVGRDVAGTGPTDPLVAKYPAGQVQFITLNAGDGADSVTVTSEVATPATISGGTDNDVILADGGTVNGDDGNDLLTGGAAADNLSGGAGDDDLYGRGGDDSLSGAGGNDKVFAGAGANTVSDGSGNDLVDLSENATPLNFSTGGGNDTVLGSAGNDRLTGSSGTDRLEGRGGNDTLIGAGGSDGLHGQEGSDRILWDEGDGSDVVEGGAGESDVLSASTGGGADDLLLQSAPGSRAEVGRTTGTAFSLDVGSVEELAVSSGPGADDIDVRSLSGTDVRSVRVDAGTDGGNGVDVHGTTGSDELAVSSPGAGTASVGGLPYTVTVAGLSASDVLRPLGGAGVDHLFVDGSAGADSVLVDLLDASSADVSGLVNATVAGRAFESLSVDGKGGGDALTVGTPTGAQDVTVTPGPAIDSAAFSVPGLLPLDHRGLGTGGSVAVANSGGTRADTLIYKGTAAGDRLGVTAPGALGLNAQLPLNPTGSATVVADLLAGDDRVSALGSLPFALSVQGGDAQDALDLSGAAGAVQVDLETASIDGYGSPVRTTGVERVSTQQTGASTPLTVLGTPADDRLSYSPTGSHAGTVVGGPFALTFAGAAGTFLLNPAGGTDRLAVVGTTAADTYKVLANSTLSAQVGSAKTLTAPQGTTELLALEGNESSDVFDVTVYDGITALLSANGDSPSAKRFSDTLRMRDGSGKAQFTDVKAHTPEDGAAIAKYRSGAQTRVDYVSVESVKFVR